MISSILTLVVIAAAIVIPGALGGGAETREIGAVGQGNEVIIEAAAEFAGAEVADEPGSEADVFETITYATRDEAVTGLRAGDVEVVLLDGDTVLVASEGFGGAPLGGNPPGGCGRREAAGARGIK